MNDLRLGHPNDPNSLRGRNALLLGLGSRQGGVGTARYLCAAGASVRVTDLRTAEELAGPLDELHGLPIEYTLGRHEESDFIWADIVVRNPAVPRESPWLALARRLGKRVETEMTLFFRACPAPIAGVTGTKGKTTTTLLLHAMMRERWPGAKSAGNMGRSALAELPGADLNVPITLELSSFQVEALHEHGFSPQVAVITNISEDHLDRYESFDVYAEVKASLASHLRPDDWLISPAGDLMVQSLVRRAPGRRGTFDANEHEGAQALWIDDGRFTGRWAGGRIDLGTTAASRLPGEHSRLNILAAAGAALALGISAAEIRNAIAGFAGISDRLEFVAIVDGVEYVNDSAATAPAAASAAINAYAGRPLIVIAGGSEKRLPLSGFADHLAASVERVILLDGTATPRLAALLAERGFRAVDGPYTGMQPAVERAADLATPGAVVLLSPGCASFGMFRDEFHRGAAFRLAVATVAAQAETEQGAR